MDKLKILVADNCVLYVKEKQQDRSFVFIFIPKSQDALTKSSDQAE